MLSSSCHLQIWFPLSEMPFLSLTFGKLHHYHWISAKIFTPIQVTTHLIWLRWLPWPSGTHIYLPIPFGYFKLTPSEAKFSLLIYSSASALLPAQLKESEIQVSPSFLPTSHLCHHPSLQVLSISLLTFSWINLFLFLHTPSTLSKLSSFFVWIILTF
jgi:hypothetical protein